MAEWEGLDQSKFLRIRIRAIPRAPLSLLQVAESIAQLLSSGIGCDDRDLKAVLLGEPSGGVIDLAIPAALAPPRLGITQLLSVLSVPSEYNHAESVVFEGIQLPTAILGEYGGPRIGVEEFGRRLRVGTGPLLGAILKPRLMRDLEKLLNDVRQIARAGLDFVVDDELTVDPDAIPFAERVPRVIDALGSGKSANVGNGFFANVTARPSRSLQLAEQAKMSGAAGLVTNPIVAGFGALEDLADQGLGLPILATNMGAALLAKGHEQGPGAGIAESVLAKLSRLAGADAVHCGIAHAGWYGDAPARGTIGVLGSSLGPILRSFRVVAGGLDVVTLIDNWPFDGEPVMFEAGSAIFDHPGGPGAGAQALRTAYHIATEQSPSDEFDPRLRAKAMLLKAAENDQALHQAISATGWIPGDSIREEMKTLSRTRGKAGTIK